MKILVVSTSLNSKSRSRKLAKECQMRLKALEYNADFIDLLDLELPLCDGETTWDHPQVQSLQVQVSRADAVIIAAPIYNWSVAATTKNFVECVNHYLDRKVIGIVCAAGGPRALLAPASFASALMADFQAVIVPQIVVIEEDQIPDGTLPDETIRRIQELVVGTIQIIAK